MLPTDELVKLRDHIVPFLKDEEAFVRKSVCETLGKLPTDEDAEAREPIKKIL